MPSSSLVNPFTLLEMIHFRTSELVSAILPEDIVLSEKGEFDK